MPSRRSNAPGRMILGLVLAVLTMVVVGILTKSTAGDSFLAEVGSILSTPSLTMARLTSANPVAWGPVFVAWGIGFYWVVWFIILTALGGTTSGTTGPR